MPGNEDLYKGMEMFSEGLAQYHTTQAVNDATEKLKQLNSHEMDRQQKLIANEQVGQELALRLTGAGAKPEQVQAATQGLMPSASTTATVAGQAGMQQAGFGQQTKEKQMDRDLALELQQMKNDAIGVKDEKKMREAAMKFGKEFGAQEHIKPLLQAIPRLDDAMENMASTNGKSGATAMVELAKLGLIRTAAGRVNEMEIDSANESPSARAKLWKKFGLEKEGEVPKNVQDFWKKIVTSQRQRTGERLQQAMPGFAQAKEIASGGGVSADQVQKMLEAQYNTTAAPKVETGRAYSKSLNQTQITYSDGSSKVVPGRQVR